jgi:hypothetical protein
LPLFYDKNLALRYIDMVILNSDDTAQSFSFYGRSLLGDTASYRIRMIDQQTKVTSSITITGVTQFNQRTTINFDMSAVDQRWYAFDVYDVAAPTNIVYKGVAFACDESQDLEKFSIYYDYNTTPSANDNTYLTL